MKGTFYLYVNYENLYASKPAASLSLSLSSSSCLVGNLLFLLNHFPYLKNNHGIGINAIAIKPNTQPSQSPGQANKTLAFQSTLTK